MKTLQIKVKPGTCKSLLKETDTGPWLAQLKSPPVDGKANLELISLLAEHFNCSRSSIQIKNGKSSKLKLVQIYL